MGGLGAGLLGHWTPGLLVIASADWVHAPPHPPWNPAATRCICRRPNMCLLVPEAGAAPVVGVKCVDAFE